MELGQMKHKYLFPGVEYLKSLLGFYYNAIFSCTVMDNGKLNDTVL
jgi:hypothetical protein